MSTIPINVCGTVATVPNLRTLPTGRPCASFRLAVNHWKLDKSTGEFVEDGTSWFGVDCYGTLASNVGTSVEQGTTVLVQGHLRNREWASGERTGIAPTVIADHIGPDLRFGTAHYRKSATTRPRPAEAVDRELRTAVAQAAQSSYLQPVNAVIAEHRDAYERL
ncbi:single-stranded DNA-binding protein, partial [Brevibacterium sp. 2SA]|uniref:single-stranded DNA-binding protein n=1 Tax=Brevibacterium sp. 2SA TaxID=2502198 RepID=UPI0010F6E215